jgi:serine/threonine protein kinase/tetratricopeptide (TPR) repeat protein
MTEEHLFELAVQASPAERAALLDRECAGNPELRARIEALLVADAQPNVTIDMPANQTGSFDEPGGEPGAVIAGRYTLVESIGEGGMGEVWVAKQSEPVKRKVALKLIKAGMDTKAVLQRFDAERQALALMDHPNIAKVFDGGMTAERRPFFVMELVDGLPLTRFCDEARLGIGQRLELFVAICQAVQHAHQKGVIHRDLKPSNILVTVVDGRPIPKIIDFGLAKALGGRLTDDSLSTQFGAVVGTFEYMSPEQAGFTSTDVDTRADIYSLGVILYELLTGLRPLDAKRLRQAVMMEMVRIIKEEEPSKPSTRISTDDSAPSLAALRHTEPKKLAALLRGELDWVVMKCLEKQRDRRYETANGLAQDIQRYLADEPVSAGPPSRGYRLKKFIRRNRGAVIAATVMVLLLLGGITGTTLGMVAASRRAEGERLANELTKRRLAQIEKGVELFAGMLRGISPRNEELGGPTVYQQLRERAEKAADELDAESVGDPTAVARLQIVLGTTLRELGNLTKAISVLERARATCERELGADHPDTLRSMNNLALAYEHAGQLDKALPLYEATLRLRKANLGADHSDTLVSMNNLATGYRAAGQIGKALPLYEEALGLLTAKVGADHPDTLRSMNNLADGYLNAGQLDKGLPLEEETLRLRKAKLGADHPDTLTSMNNLAEAYRSAGQLDKELPLLEEALRLMKAKLGADHPDTLKVLANLASANRNAGRLDLALPLLEEGSRLMKAKFGPDHPVTLTSMNNLASGYRYAGQLDKALPIYEDTLGRMKAKLGPDHPNTLTTSAGLARILHQVKRSAEASQLFDEVLFRIEMRRYQLPNAGPIFAAGVTCFEESGDLPKGESWRRKWLSQAKAKSGADSPAYATELTGLGGNLIQQNKYADAEAVLRESLAICEKKAPEAWTTFNTQSTLGAALAGQQKYAEAEPLLLKGYEGMKRRENTIPKGGVAELRISEAIDHLIDLYIATNMPDKATKWQSERAKYPDPKKEPERK